MIRDISSSQSKGTLNNVQKPYVLSDNEDTKISRIRLEGDITTLLHDIEYLLTLKVTCI